MRRRAVGAINPGWRFGGGGVSRDQWAKRDRRRSLTAMFRRRKIGDARLPRYFSGLQSVSLCNHCIGSKRDRFRPVTASNARSGIFLAVNGNLQGVASDPIQFTVLIPAAKVREAQPAAVLAETAVGSTGSNGNGHRNGHANGSGAHSRVA